MKIFLTVIFIFQLLSTKLYSLEDCKMCANYASNAYNYSVKAYYSLNLEDCKKNSMRAIKELSMSEEKGYDCSCTAAAKEASFGKKDAKDAFYSTNLKSCKHYALRTFKHSGLAQDLAIGCK